MESSKRNKPTILILILIVIISTISVVFFVQNIIKPSAAPHSSSTPISSPSPTENIPTPTSTKTPTSTPTLTATSIPTFISNPTPATFLFPGEVIQYQGQNLTPVSVYIDYLIQHPDVAIAGTQNINRATYHLALTGLVNNSLNYTYDEVINNFNSTLQVATLPCVEGWSVTMLWQGITVTDLLQQAGVNSNATTLIFVASDGYSTSLPLDYVSQNNITIAYKMNNVTLSPQTGWPFFLVAKNQYGYKWIEWLTEINVSNNSNYLGYWESRGYPNNATVFTPKNVTQPLSSVPMILPVIATLIAFVAFAVVVFYSRLKAKKRQKVTLLENAFFKTFWQPG